MEDREKAEKAMNLLNIVLAIVLGLLAGHYVMGQSPIGIQSVTTGYYECYIDGVYVDRHTSISKADAHCTEMSYNKPDAIVGFTHPEFTKIKVTGQPVITVDTIQVNRRLDVDNKPVGGFLDKVKGDAYFLTHEIEGMVGYPADSINSWQYIYNLEKTVNKRGEVSYENLTVPFQYMDVWMVSYDEEYMALHVHITEKQTRITEWIDGVKIKEYLPGSSNEIPGGWHYWFSIPKTADGKEFKMEVEYESGEVITYELTLKI